jgi:hypothetical protein
MKRFRLFLIGVFAAFLPMLMAPTGGFPSNPSFQTVTAIPGAAAKFGVNLNSTTAIGYNAIRWQTSGVATAYAASEVSAGQLCNGSSVGDYCIRVVSGRVRTSTDNGITSGIVPRTAYGIVNTSGATCTSVTVASGVSGTCTHTGTGTYQITFSPVFSSAPVCTASVAGALVFVTATAGTGTNASFVTFNTAFTQTDTSTAVNFICTL